MRQLFFLIALLILACKEEKSTGPLSKQDTTSTQIKHSKGFRIVDREEGLKILYVTSPWPNSDLEFKYALVPNDRKKLADKWINEVDAVIPIPVEKLVVTSTTHIPALESLGVTDRLIGFPQTKYVSSPDTRSRIDSGEIHELGSNESLNTEMTIAIEPDLIVGFGIDNQNKAYQAIESTGIPVVYNGDWAEETPLGKAEWIKFFAPFFGLESKADSIFRQIEKDYTNLSELAQTATHRPVILSGALYKDVWYLPAGDSWAARFIEDANGNYLWRESKGTGSLSLGLESVLERGTEADIWISPSQFTSYSEMERANDHYAKFKPFQERRLFTFSGTRGPTGGLWYYELAPSRPDIVLKDLIHIFHPELLPDHELYFFKPVK